ncbi:MAG: GTPase domain-containing protein, partial [Chloroflexota bacterium]
MDLLAAGKGRVGDFVSVVKQVRTDEIAAEAERSFRIALVGPRGAGKTTLLHRFAAGTFGGLLEPFGLRRIVEYDLPLSPQEIEDASRADLVIWLDDLAAMGEDPSFAFLHDRAAAFLQVANKADLLLGELPPARRGTALISALSAD